VQASLWRYQVNPIWPTGMRKKALHALAMLLLATFPCVSEMEIRSVTGVVTDKRGNPLPGAVVQLENAATLLVRSYLTGKDGLYRFSRLYGDVDYTLRAKYRNYWSKPKTLSKFDSSKPRNVGLVIPIE